MKRIVDEFCFFFSSTHDQKLMIGIIYEFRFLDPLVRMTLAEKLPTILKFLIEVIKYVIFFSVGVVRFLNT